MTRLRFLFISILAGLSSCFGNPRNTAVAAHKVECTVCDRIYYLPVPERGQKSEQWCPYCRSEYVGHWLGWVEVIDGTR